MENLLLEFLILLHSYGENLSLICFITKDEKNIIKISIANIITLYLFTSFILLWHINIKCLFLYLFMNVGKFYYFCRGVLWCKFVGRRHLYRDWVIQKTIY